MKRSSDGVVIVYEVVYLVGDGVKYRVFEDNARPLYGTMGE